FPAYRFAPCGLRQRAPRRSPTRDGTVQRRGLRQLPAGGRVLFERAMSEESRRMQTAEASFRYSPRPCPLNRAATSDRHGMMNWADAGRGGTDMSKTKLGNFTLGATLVSVLLLTPSMSIAQAPPPRPLPIMPPSLPPSQVVDLMTQPGIATLGGQWK